MMQLLTREICKLMPRLYATDGMGDESQVIVKFFTPWSNWTWYAKEASAYVSLGGAYPEQVSLENVSCDNKNNLSWVDNDGYSHIVEDIEFFGLVQGLDLELGYFSFNELKDIEGPAGLRIERDINFSGKTIGQCRTYHETGHWPRES